MSGRKAARRPKAHKTERNFTPLEIAQAAICIHEQGAAIRPIARNPFQDQNSARDTVSNVAQGLELYSQLSLTDAGIASSKSLDYAQFLILQAMKLALDAADEQMKQETQLAKARGVVEAANAVKVAKGAK